MQALAAGSVTIGSTRRYSHLLPPTLYKMRSNDLRFPFPTPLVRIWSEAANGGIGPGYGIYGLEGGLTNGLNDLPLPDLWSVYLDDPAGTELIGEKSAPKSFPICSWGCCKESWIDCSSTEGNMMLITDQGVCIDQGVSFARWIEDWLEGIDVGADSYGPRAK